MDLDYTIYRLGCSGRLITLNGRMTEENLLQGNCAYILLEGAARKIIEDRQASSNNLALELYQEYEIELNVGKYRHVFRFELRPKEDFDIEFY